MDSVSITWYGQSGFRLAAGDSRILIDPFLTDRSDRRYPPPASAADFADVTLVLCTHEHVDHLDLPFLREFCAVNSQAPIVVPAPVVEIAAKAGVGRDRLTGAAPGELFMVRNVGNIVPSADGGPMGGVAAAIEQVASGSLAVQAAFSLVDGM